MPEKKKVRSTPRLSANALAGYMSAGATRRKTILKEQKYPATFRANWYEVATRTIVKCLLHPERDEEIVVSTLDKLHGDPGGTENEQLKRRNNAEALDLFLTVRELPEFDGLAVRAGPAKAIVTVEGTELSIRPEVVMAGAYRGGQVRGGLKLSLSKNNSLDEDAGAVVGTLVNMLIAEGCGENESCKTRHCQVLDVFAKEIYNAPTAIVKLRREIEDACAEIAERWPNV